MLTGFALVFCVIAGLLFLFFGLIWNSGDMTNLVIKAANFIGMLPASTWLFAAHTFPFHTWESWGSGLCLVGSCGEPTHL